MDIHNKLQMSKRTGKAVTQSRLHICYQIDGNLGKLESA